MKFRGCSNTQNTPSTALYIYAQSTTGTEFTAKDVGSIVRRWALRNLCAPTRVGAHRFRGVINRTIYTELLWFVVICGDLQLLQLFAVIMLDCLLLL